MFSFDRFVETVHSFYGKSKVGLHEPCFDETEIKQISDCIRSGYVSSVGEYVVEFEKQFANIVGTRSTIAVVNGTCGLQAAIVGCGVGPGDKVIVPNVTFIATANAVRHAGATPIFIDIEPETLGLSPDHLRTFLTQNCTLKNGSLIEKTSGAKIFACVPVHVLGNPCYIEEIVDICNEFGLICIEDAAESLGSYIGDKHVGSTGKLSVFSFNGNKIVTTGGGGMIATNDIALGKKLKHLTTTARVSAGYNFVHDEVGYNFRMPNLNAALGLAQLKKLDHFLERKETLKNLYAEIFESAEAQLIAARAGTTSNNWLIGVRFAKFEQRESFLKMSNEIGLATRPLWTPMSELPMNKVGIVADYPVADDCFKKTVCLPSGAY